MITHTDRQTSPAIVFTSSFVGGNNTTIETSFGEDAVKIRPAIAEQSCQKKKHRTVTKI